ncbi:4-fold beta flower protein [Listeria innocua]|uniref:4-fold beta flower protein n=1 Tax=Listeria innocua TaxID=1642 RepID=UPI00162893A2|nr:hypothetical protein [Listeria innocua]EKZ4847848.1 hypothetical protein [Listeria monocytogenes]MBC1910693.1 hypothetical protein [Listeria innocua]MBC1925490.1 hypothetical protein [Listeria innocua]MBC1928891.1 hypothetical protein [Listeria innocua]
MNFYNKQGKPIAYLADEKHIFLFSGKAVAYFVNDAVYSFCGKHLGWLRNGWIVDHDGRRVFFTENTTGGPVKPIKQIKPIKSIKNIKPIKSVKEVKRTKSSLSSSWSALSDESFFS